MPKSRLISIYVQTEFNIVNYFRNRENVTITQHKDLPNFHT